MTGHSSHGVLCVLKFSYPLQKVRLIGRLHSHQSSGLVYREIGNFPTVG